MREKVLKSLAALTVLVVVAACGTTEDNSYVRQGVIAEDGGWVSSDEPVNAPYVEFLEVDRLQVQDNEGRPELSDEFLAVLDWFEGSLGRFPVMLTVPVEWVPEGALAGGRDVSKSVAVRDQRQKIDVAVEAVRKALFSSSEYSRSSIDYGEYKRLYMEWQGIEDGLSIINPDSMKPSPSRQLRWTPSSQRSSFQRNTTRSFQLTARDYFTSLQPSPGLRALVNIQELKMLIRKGLVSGIELDGVVVPMLADSTASDLIASEEMSNFLGLDGTGTAVAILDTGTYLNHPAFVHADGTSKIVAEGCFVADNTCPNGTNIDISAGSSTPCIGWSDRGNDNTADFPCDHGTHVAGTAVGSAVPAGLVPSGPPLANFPPAVPAVEWHAGVAPGADLVSIRIADQGGGSFASSYALGFNYVGFLATGAPNANIGNVNLGALPQINVVSANLSFGGGRRLFSCDNNTGDQSDLSLVTTAINALVALNVAPTVASGNDGWRNAMSRPSCVSNAIAVGNTQKDDAVSNCNAPLMANGFFALNPPGCGSNVNNRPDANGNPLLDLYAPGTRIVAASGVSTNPNWVAPPNAPQMVLGPVAALDNGLPQGSLEFQFKTGTSMAAPHVAGAWALVRQKFPNMNVATALNLLQGTGVQLTDNRPSVWTLQPGQPGNPGQPAQAVQPNLFPPGGGGVTARVDLEAALLEDTKPLGKWWATSIDAPGLEKSKTSDVQEVYPGARRTFSQGTGLTQKALGPNPVIAEWEGDISLQGSPVNPISASLDKAFLYFSTQNALANSIQIAGNTYVVGQSEFRQVGYSISPCQNLQRNPMRSYRVDITASAKGLVKGNNAVKIQVANPAGIVDGASILLISKARRVSRGTQKGGVVLVHGASVLDGNSKATANLKPSLNPTSPIDLSMDDMAIRFHVGIGEGESYYESGIWFKGGTEESGFSKIVTAPSLFSGSDGGSDGSHWDDITFNLDEEGLFGTPYFAKIAHFGHEEPYKKDCLGWVYAALNIYPGTLRDYNTIPGLKTGNQKYDQQPEELKIEESPKWAPTEWELEYLDPDLIPTKPEKARQLPPIPNN